MPDGRAIAKALPQARMHRVLDRFGYEPAERYAKDDIRQYVYNEEQYGTVHTHPKGHWVHVGSEGSVIEMGHGHATLYRHLKSLPWHDPEDEE